jgi:hypothetical protein
MDVTSTRFIIAAAEVTWRADRLLVGREPRVAEQERLAFSPAGVP